LEVAVILITTGQLVMHKLHEVRHAVFSLSQLTLDSLQICAKVEGGILLYHKCHLLDVYGGGDGLNKSR
jgi:hypothetical protein